MAEAIVTLKARKKMLLARAGECALPKVVGIAFGDGGVDPAGNVIAPAEDQESLNSEIFRKEIDSHTLITDFQCRYECTLLEEELVGESISEIALYDEEGDLVAIKNFTAKGKDNDFRMTFQIDDTF